MSAIGPCISDVRLDGTIESTAQLNSWTTTTQLRSLRGSVRGSVKFCIAGLTQSTHHFSSDVTPTISLLFVVFLCYVVLCVVLALNCLCIISPIATWWLKSTERKNRLPIFIGFFELCFLGNGDR